MYNKHTSQIIGLVNLGNTEQQLLALEQEERGTGSRVATHGLQFMVRGGGIWSDYPVSYFATSSLSAEVIGAVESTGLKMMIVTADGAFQNRKFFRMHRDPSGSNVSNGITYKAINIYAPES